MDTKLKNYRFSVWFKLFSVVLCISGVLTVSYGLLRAEYFEYAFQNKEFKESGKLKDILFKTFNTVSDIALKFKNEDYIKSGKALDDQELNLRTSFLYADKANEIEQIENKYNELIANYKGDDRRGIEILTNQKATEIEKIEQKYTTMVVDIKDQYIKEQLSDYHLMMDNLNNNNTEVIYTVIENDKVILSNAGNTIAIDDFYKGLPYYTKITRDNIYSFFSKSYYLNYLNPDPNSTVYLGLSKEKYDTELIAFSQNQKEGLLGVKISALGLIAFLIGLINIVYVSGRRVDREGIHLIAIDAVYLDVALAVSIGAIILCMTPIGEFGDHLFRDKTYLNTDILKVLFAVSLTFGTIIAVTYISMLTKRIKRREVIRHTLIFKICSWLISKFKNIFGSISEKIHLVYDGSPAVMRLVLIFGAYAVVTVICIVMIIAGNFATLMGLAALAGINVVAIYSILKILKTFRDINMGAERLRAGELSHIIPEQGIPELRHLASTLNRIADGLKSAVSSQVRAERMKAELITNVSHDLKTPLTSIITYVDLLKNEGLQSDNALKYLGVIDTKSQRLKILTEDLFEAAKASSGNIPVNLEKLNIVSLINQGLGELSDKIEASGLSFKTTLPVDKILVNADGKLLWRVIENVLSNVFKYALPQSRVYIDTTVKAENICISIKNISAYELNISADELMERFKRGDASRHSEGSGLGLSIARSLTELQGGSFHIEIDGDLFKSVIELPKCN